METFYQSLGEATAVRNIVDRFYDLMDQDPRFAKIRELHPKNLNGSREKLYMFLSGWLGGPSLYIERFGHPRLRMRHLPFSIGEEERDQWMTCMSQALDDLNVTGALKRQLIDALSRTADHMRNREG